MRKKKPIGIIERLQKTIDELLRLKQENDLEEKEQGFLKVFDELEEIETEIQELMENLDDNIPKKIKDLCRETDDKFMEAASTFLDAIDMMIEFMETEEMDLIYKAKELLGEGMIQIEQADAMAHGLNNVSFIDGIKA